MAIRAFLSFVEEDLNLVNLFRGQAKNEALDLEFHDYSIKIPFDSTNADYIGRGIADQIKYCKPNHFAFLDRQPIKAKWVVWELNKTLSDG